MAKLTTLSKVLIGSSILAVACGTTTWIVRTLMADTETTASSETDPSAPAPMGGKDRLGTATNPIKMSIVSFTGYAPALVANGNSLTTQPGSIYADLGVSVEFILQDNIPTLAENFGGGTAHCSWRTVDFWAQEHPGLKASGYDARMVAIVDNTRGADAIVARAGIQSVEDLAGKKVGLLEFTPSHWMLDYAIENSSMSKRQKQQLRDSLVFSQGDLAEIRAMLKANQIDAAVLWDPDTSLAQRDIPGTHVVFSTSVASNLIFDGIVCDSRIIESSPDAVGKLVAGWMRGVESANADKSKATAALIATEDYFEELNRTEGPGFIDGLYPGIKWTGLADNLRILGLSTAGGDALRVYREAGVMWRKNGGIADLSSPPIPPSNAFDTQFIERLAAEVPEAAQQATQPEFTFTASERQEAQQEAPVLTKPVSIYFAVGSAELDENTKSILDDQVIPLIESVGSAYISIEGNTDKTGGRNANIALSHKRAKSVSDYLVDEWEFPADRFEVRGNGPDKPLCTESTPDCYERNRRTDIAVYSR